MDDVLATNGFKLIIIRVDLDYQDRGLSSVFLEFFIMSWIRHQKAVLTKNVSSLFIFHNPKLFQYLDIIILL